MNGDLIAVQASAKKVPLFEFPALAAARQTDQPKHNQSADSEKLKLNLLNLASFLLLKPVQHHHMFRSFQT